MDGPGSSSGGEAVGLKQSASSITYQIQESMRLSALMLIFASGFDSGRLDSNLAVPFYHLSLPPFATAELISNENQFLH
jgi:hypothetical protein